MSVKQALSSREVIMFFVLFTLHRGHPPPSPLPASLLASLPTSLHPHSLIFRSQETEIQYWELTHQRWHWVRDKGL